MPATKKSKVKSPTPAQLAEGLIISVGESRKILGSDANEMSDDEIAILVLQFSDMAYELLKYKHFAK